MTLIHPKYAKNKSLFDRRGVRRLDSSYLVRRFVPARVLQHERSVARCPSPTRLLCEHQRRDQSDSRKPWPFCGNCRFGIGITGASRFLLPSPGDERRHSGAGGVLCGHQRRRKSYAGQPRNFREYRRGNIGDSSPDGLVLPGQCDEQRVARPARILRGYLRRSESNASQSGDLCARRRCILGYPGAGRNLWPGFRA